jgi:hypothetical protein
VSLRFHVWSKVGVAPAAAVTTFDRMWNERTAECAAAASRRRQLEVASSSRFHNASKVGAVSGRFRPNVEPGMWPDAAPFRGTLCVLEVDLGRKAELVARS